MYTQVGDSFSNKSFIEEQMFRVRCSDCKTARFVQVHYDGSIRSRGWGSALIISDLDMYYSVQAEEYVLVNTKTDKQVVVFRGTSYECALFIARRARAFGFAIYATDVPLEANDAEEC